MLGNEWPQLKNLWLGCYFNNLGKNNIGDQGIVLLIERQLPINRLAICNYVLDTGNNNITVKGLKSMLNFNCSELK